MTPAEAIKKIRWELRLTQIALAQEIGCSQSAIASYEKILRLPSYAILKKLDDFAKKNKVKVTFL